MYTMYVGCVLMVSPLCLFYLFPSFLSFFPPLPLSPLLSLLCPTSSVLLLLHLHPLPLSPLFSIPPLSSIPPFSLNYTTLSCRGGTVVNLDLVNPEMKKKKKKYVNSGILHFVSVQLVLHYD